MNIFTRARIWLARGLYKVATGQSLSFLPDWVRHTYFVPTWQAIVKDGIKGNSAVFACISALVFGFSEPPLLVWSESDDGLQPLPKHRARQLIRRPNPDQGESEFKSSLMLYCAPAGNAYIWKQRNRGGLPVALWPFSDGQMKPVPGHNTTQGIVAYYVLDIGDGNQYNPFEVERFDDMPGVAIPKRDVVHWKWLPDPEQPWLGMGAVAGAAADIDTDSEIRSYVFSLLKNDASPRVVVTLVEGEEADPDKIKRLQAQWIEKYGRGNRGAPAFLEAGMTVNQLSMNLQQLAYEALHNIPESRIAAAFRVPPIIAGLNIGLQRSTFANYSEARQAFTEETLIPLWRSLESELEQSLADDFGSDLILQHDLSQVRALQEDQDALWKRAQMAWDSGLLTRAKALRLVKLRATPEDEVYKVGLATLFLPVGETMARPQPAQISDQAPKGFAWGGTIPPPETLTYSVLPARKRLLPANIFQKAHTGAMVALMLPPAAAAMLQPVIDSLPPGSLPVPGSELHLTLAYLGDTDNLLISPMMVLGVLRKFAAEWGPMMGLLNGWGEFNLVQEDGTIPVYASFDSPRLPGFRQALIESLTLAGIAVDSSHGFVPHITLGYVPQDAETILTLPRNPVVFNDVSLAWSGNKTHFRLVGAKGDSPRIETKVSRAQLTNIVNEKRRVRALVAGRAEGAVAAWFEKLADAVIDAAAQIDDRVKGVKAIGPGDWDQLMAQLFQQQAVGLDNVLKRYTLEVIALTWPLMNLELESEVQFLENDPLVQGALSNAGANIPDMLDTTRQALTSYLQTAYADGTPIQEMAERIRGLITETYQNRAEAVARTEIGNAQNNATNDRYAAAGVEHCLVFDNGFDNSHEFCKRVDGKVVTLDWARRNSLQHPNCVRCFGAVFDYAGDVFTEEVPWG